MLIISNIIITKDEFFYSLFSNFFSQFFDLFKLLEQSKYMIIFHSENFWNFVSKLSILTNFLIFEIVTFGKLVYFLNWKFF